MATETYRVRAVLSATDQSWSKGLNNAIRILSNVKKATSNLKKDAKTNIRAVNESFDSLKHGFDKMDKFKGKGFDRAKRSAEDMARVIRHIPAPVKKSADDMADATHKMAGKFRHNVQDLKSSLNNLKTHTDKTHSAFRSIFSGTLVANGVTSAFGAVKSAIGGVYESAKDYAYEQQTMNATWLTLTNSASKGEAMVNQINKMATSAQNSTQMVDSLSQKFYAINNNASQTGKLTQSILTLQDAFGKTDAAVENFGTQFSQMMANGKVSAQDMMSIVNVFPKLRLMLLDYERNLHHNRNMTMQELNKMISDGKVKSQDMINVVNEAGQKYKAATGNFTKTIPGMVRVIKSQMQVLLGSITQPLAKMKRPIYATISKWVSSAKTHKEFENLGKTVSTGMTKVMKAFSNGKTVNITKALDNAINGINSALKGMFSWLADHAQDIKTIVSSLISITSQIGKSVWKSFASIITVIGHMFGITAKHGKSSSDAIHVIAQVLNKLANNKLAIEAIAKAIVAIALVKGLAKVGTGLYDIGAKGYHTYKNVKALRDGLKDIKNIKDFSSTEQAFFKLGQSVKGVWQSIKGFLTSAKGLKAGKIVGATGTALVAGQQGIEAIKDRHSADKRSQDIGGAVGAVAGGALTSLIPVVGPMLAPLGAIIGKYAGRWGGQAVNNFTKGWQRNKPPKKFWSLENLGYSAHNMWKGFKSGVLNVFNWFKKNWKILPLLANPFTALPTLLYKLNPKFRKWVKDLIKSIKSLGTSIHKLITGTWKAIKTNLNNILKGIKTAFKNNWRAIKDLTKQVFNNVAGFIKRIWKSIHETIKSILKAIKDTFKNIWNTIKNTTEQVFNNIAKFIKSLWQGVKSTISSIIKVIYDSFHSKWQALVKLTHSTFNAIYDHIVKPIKDSYDHIKAFITAIIKRFQSLGNINLMKAGQAVMNSFHKGLTAVWSKIKGFVHKIAPWMVHNKGPIEYDAKLLVPAGQAIMQGFGKGLKTEYQKLQTWLKNITNQMNQMFENAVGNLQKKIDKKIQDRDRSTIRRILARGEKNYSTWFKNFRKSGVSYKIASKMASRLRKSQINKDIEHLHLLDTLDRRRLYHTAYYKLQTQANAELSKAISAKLKHINQPATIKLNLGGQEYRTFVSDITKEQDKQYDLSQRRD